MGTCATIGALLASPLEAWAFNPKKVYTIFDRLC